VRKDGFTVVEMLVTAFLFVLVMLAVVTAGIQMRSIFQSTDISAVLQQEARVAIRVITDDLRKTNRSRITITRDYPEAGTDRIVYELPQDSDSDGVPDFSGGLIWDINTVTIQLEEAGSTRLIRSQGSDTTVLAENVKSINFADSGIDTSLYINEVKIDLELEGSVGATRTTGILYTFFVRMRN
jgi:hypothetical protein